MISALVHHTESVLIVVPRWVRDGGVAAHVALSAQALAARGTRVSLLVARVEEEFSLPGVQLIHSPQLFKREEPIATRLGEALSMSPSVVHLNQVGDPAIVRFLRERAPVVVSAHGYLACTSGVHYFRPGEECTRAHGAMCVPHLLRCAHTRKPHTLPGAYRTAAEELQTLRLADLTISYSSSVDRHLAINGVERRARVPYFPTLEVAPRSAGRDARRVIFVGRIVAPKGLATLLHAMAKVSADLVVCGDGWQLASMQRLARRLRLAGRVDFRGWLAPRELARELADASLLALPSLWPEPFGIVGIEAFAAGRPAIASATGGVLDWLEPGVSGLTVPAGNAKALAGALEELLDDPERQARMGAAGAASVQERFTLEHHLTAISGAYATARQNWLATREAQPSLAAA